MTIPIIKVYNYKKKKKSASWTFFFFGEIFASWNFFFDKCASWT